MDDVVAIIGLRGFGIACARRMGVGKTLVLGDVNLATLKATESTLSSEGFILRTQCIDIADRSSVDAFVALIAKTGTLRSLVLTAGLSPHMGTPDRILTVNMLGTINVLEAFLPLAGAGSTAIVISSNAGYLAPVPNEIERKLALDDPSTLIDVVRTVPGSDTGLGAYWLSKRANHLRVEAAAPEWGRRGARILTVSPGIMSTPMTKFEQESGSKIQAAIANTPVCRIGVAEDIAATVDWLCGSNATFITGTDILVDGGMTSALRWTNFKTDDPTV